MLKTRWIRIEPRADTACEFCGYPLFHGDQALLAEDDRGEVLVCGLLCAEQALRLKLRRNVAEYHTRKGDWR